LRVFLEAFLVAWAINPGSAQPNSPMDLGGDRKLKPVKSRPLLLGMREDEIERTADFCCFLLNNPRGRADRTPIQ